MSATASDTLHYPVVRLPAAVRAWFGANNLRPQPFQRQVWRAHAAGESGLINAPTGAGKTLGAALGPLLRSHERGVPPITLLWITPLRALSADTARQLQDIVDGIGSTWTVGVRTGDTKPAERARQRRRLPSILITTPESFALLLSYADTRSQLLQVRDVVVDEWHELMSSKRGVQVQLCLAHLRAHGTIQTWGLSATISNLEEAKRVLLGNTCEGVLIRARNRRAHHVRTIIPHALQRFPWAGHLGLSQLASVIETIEGAASTLLFTNTRSQAERWFEAITRSRLDWLGSVALHHGSISPAVRNKIETLLRAGELKCVVATSSLDLGVDFSPVEQVIQVGSPKGVARLSQRAGRSGHNPSGVSELVCVPTHGLELVEFAAARQAMKDAEIEPRLAPTQCMDVLVQHLVTLALAGGVNPDSVFSEAASTAAFADLSVQEWQWVVDFVTLGGAALGAYEEYRRLQWLNGALVSASETQTRRHRMAIGTIGSNDSVKVRFRRGAVLGTIDESFIARLVPGDAFLFAGKTLELCAVRDMVATVKVATTARTLVPRWNGGRLPLSSNLARAFREQLAQFEREGANTPEMRAAEPMLRLQQHWSKLPTTERLVVEQVKTRQGYSLFVFPFAGRQANSAIAALLAGRLSRERPMTLTFNANDYGLEIFSLAPFDLEHDDVARLIRIEDFKADLLAASNLAELARSRFRDIARISGLVFQGYPGSRKSMRQIQASSGLLYDVLVKYDRDNALVAQAQREVLSETFDLPRVEGALRAMAGQSLCLQIPPALTPFTMPLWADRQGAMLSSEGWEQRIQSMLAKLERMADKSAPDQMRVDGK